MLAQAGLDVVAGGLLFPFVLVWLAAIASIVLLMGFGILLVGIRAWNRFRESGQDGRGGREVGVRSAPARDSSRAR